MSEAERAERGRKKREHKKRRRKLHRKLSQNRGADEGLTIKAFCLRNAISESLYFTLKRLGKGPREAKLCNRIVIFPEAEADWRRDRERETMLSRQQAEPTVTA